MSGLIAAFGETLWDLLPDGSVLGGAPCNFAYRVHSLGGQATLVSRLGNDPLGAQALRQVESLGLPTRFIQRDPSLPTGTVNIEFDGHGQPSYEIVRNVAYDAIEATGEVLALASNCRCICFGTLAQRSEISRATLKAMLDALDRQKGAFAFLDINLRNNCYTPAIVDSSLARADLVKLNEGEAGELALMLGIDSRDLTEIGRALIERYSLRLCVMTLGDRGALCVCADGEKFYDPGYEVTVVDPCGSGDAFSAGFLMKYLQGEPIASCCLWGNILGAIVATQRGATAPISQQLTDQFSQNSGLRRISDLRFICHAIQQEGIRP